jgi:hypothetical protein
MIKLKKNLDISTDDFWGDLMDSGYLKPEEMCVDPVVAKRIREAMALLEDFQASCESQIKEFIR